MLEPVLGFFLEIAMFFFAGSSSSGLRKTTERLSKEIEEVSSC
jgi:hypothetical protein